jgi:hypothetical protein
VKVTALFMLVITSWLVITAHSHVGLRAGLVRLHVVASQSTRMSNQPLSSTRAGSPSTIPVPVARPPQEGTSRPKGS